MAGACFTTEGDASEAPEEVLHHVPAPLRTPRSSVAGFSNPDCGSIYGPLVTHALRDWGSQTLILALDTSILFEKFCLIRVSVLFRGRAVPLVSRVLGHSSPQVSTDHLRPVLAEIKGLVNFMQVDALVVEIEDVYEFSADSYTSCSSFQPTYGLPSDSGRLPGRPRGIWNPLSALWRLA